MGIGVPFPHINEFPSSKTLLPLQNLKKIKSSLSFASLTIFLAESQEIYIPLSKIIESERTLLEQRVGL